MPLKMFYTRFHRPGQLLFVPTDHQIRIAIWKVSLLQTLTFIECRIPNASEPNQYAKIDRFTLFCYVDIVVNVTFNRELKIKYKYISIEKKSRIESWQEGSKQTKQIPKSCPKSNWNIRWEEIFHTDHTKINMDCRNARITNNRSNQNPWQISRKEMKKTTTKKTERTLSTCSDECLTIKWCTTTWTWKLIHAQLLATV